MKFRTLLMVVVLFGFVLSFVPLGGVSLECKYDSDCPDDSHVCFPGEVLKYYDWYCDRSAGSNYGECDNKQYTEANCNDDDGVYPINETHQEYRNYYCYEASDTEAYCTYNTISCGDFGMVPISAKSYCRNKGPDDGYDDCVSSGERAYFYIDGDKIKYHCKDMYKGIFGACSDNVETWGTYPESCNYVIYHELGVLMYDSECFQAVDCSPSNNNIETSPALAGCEYLDGQTCTNSEGNREGICSKGKCEYCPVDGCRYGEYRDYYASGGNCTYDVLDGDKNQAYCCSPHKWNIGGEVSATTCCGDDGSEYVSGRVADNTLDPLSAYNPFPNDSDNDEKACCNSSTDCVYNNNCYTSNTQGPDVDDDGDYDWCGYPGTWRDCNTDAQCGGGNVFGDYEVCDTNSHDCKLACYNKTCVAGQSYCDDEFLGETLYCMNSTSSATQSSYVENPAGGNDNEGYCLQDEYYDPNYGCKPKEGKDFCYNYLDGKMCGTGNTASVVDCNLIGQYCSFDDGTYKDVVVIEATEDPLQVVGKGLRSPTNTSEECKETDGGDDPKNWGCAYIMHAEDNDDGQVEDGEEDDDYQSIVVEVGCDYNSSDDRLIEYYCSEEGDEILTKEYICKTVGKKSKTPHCFETPSGSGDSDEEPKERRLNSLIGEWL